MMIKAFEIAGYGPEVVESKFPALYNAFKFGAPPHAGIAPGVDRMVMLLANEPNIREVIAFPMNKNAQDLLMGAPGEVTQKQLDEVHIELKKEEKKQVPTLYAIKPAPVPPYNKIGHYNEAIEGKEK